MATSLRLSATCIRRGWSSVVSPITVHILFGMGKMVAAVNFVEQVKRESSKFVKTLGTKYTKFYWQRGYGMSSVSPKDRDEAQNYVRNQEEHHQGQTFQSEFRAMLTRYGVEFEEQYVWD